MAIKSVHVSAYTVPTDLPEADGTIEWKSTTMIVVEIEARGIRGIGYSYNHPSAAALVRDVLRDVVTGLDEMDIAAAGRLMLRQVRNIGRSGVAAAAISAVDNALWDLKAKILKLPLASLLGRTREGVLAYGSGGFTSYNKSSLQAQLGGWAEQGLRMVKMKIGADADSDLQRVKWAREAIGPEVKLFVDANGGYSVKQALSFAEKFEDLNVEWFEEPVSSDDLSGLNLIKMRAPNSMKIAAGEYGDSPYYFNQMLRTNAVDVIQADATRCLGISGFLAAASICEGFQIPLSAHTAPTVHLPVCSACERVVHLEYFHDHVRIEEMFFEGRAKPRDGVLFPDLSRLGFGVEFKRIDAEKFRVSF